MTSAIQEMEQRLLTLRAEYISRIEAIKVDAGHKDEPVEKDFAEQVTQRENEDVLGALDQEARVQVQQIDRALERLRQGDYGICVECGARIAPARLQAVPFAELCIDCAEMADRRS